MAEKEFIVGNFGDFLKVPFSEFSGFQKSMTKIEISHADSFSLGAYERISDYSKAY